jgi:periplasmic protein TonB
VLRLDQLAPPTPHLPQRRSGALWQFALSSALHAAAIIVLAALVTPTAAGISRSREAVRQQESDVRRVVFLAPESSRPGSGGGGGGNRQPAPIRRAQGMGTDAITLRVRKPAPVAAPVRTASPVPDAPAPPSIVVDATPLASGILDQLGLPVGGVPTATSLGPGAGGGVGTGVGSGIGSGRGPGLGPGSGGGTGGGIYLPGGAVTTPRLIKEVKPRYTNEAILHKVQGSVVLEVVVTCDGTPARIRVVRSLDPGGLDEQAVVAVEQWRFEPGRRAGTPVDVLVTVILDFSLR